MSRLFAISDIHGCYKPFYELIVNKIDLKKSDRLILLGDYIDRGENSREVIDFIIDLIKKGFDITPLTGNHEQMLINAYNDIEELPLWIMNSGDSTLLSFGSMDIREMGGKYIDFFTSLEYYKKIGNFIFVHAGFNDYASDPFTDNYNMVWECRPSYENKVFWGQTIIHGHRPKFLDYILKLIREKSNVIPIDTGCVYEKELGYGMLSALEAGSMTLFTVPNQ
jgi:serine/threonine protein phosphatase 1